MLKKQKKTKIKSQIDKTAYDNAVISWITPEYILHEKGRLWTIIAVITVIIAAILGILTDGWTFSLAVVVFAVVYYILHIEHPKDLEVKISEFGIKIGAKIYSFNNIKAFWIIYEPPYVKTLTIQVKGEWLSEVVIQLNGEDPSKVRQFLGGKLPELKDKAEAFSDVLLRIFKI